MSDCLLPFYLVMAHKKGGGSSRNGRDSKSKRLGVKSFAGQTVTARLNLSPPWGGVVDAVGGGPVIVRDRQPVFRSLTRTFTGGGGSTPAPDPAVK